MEHATLALRLLLELIQALWEEQETLPLCRLAQISVLIRCAAAPRALPCMGLLALLRFLLELVQATLEPGESLHEQVVIGYEVAGVRIGQEYWRRSLTAWTRAYSSSLSLMLSWWVTWVVVGTR